MDQVGQRRTARAVLALAGILWLGGCAGKNDDTPEPARVSDTPTQGSAFSASAPKRVVIDGVTDEWASALDASADADSIALRFSTPVPGHALQAAPQTTTIAIDLDGDANTGRRVPLGLGAEVLIELSPAWEGSPGGGARVTLINRGESTTIGHRDSGLVFLPTYAADAYELTIDRANLPAASGRARAGVVGEGAVVEFDLPQAGKPDALTGVVADKPRGGLRIVSHNVLRSKPLTEPEPFARLYDALDPDVVLVQEWDGTGDEALAEWFTEHVGGAWFATTDADRGVSIASRHPFVTRVGGSEPSAERPPRATMGVVRTPMGDVLLGTLHLKCCGGAGTSEDQRRIREGEGIRATVQALYNSDIGGSIAHTVLGGDLNLVGTHTALEVIADGTDLDGSALEIAPTPVLGGQTWATWRGGPRSSFTPGRLDFLLWSDASADRARSFALDTRELAPGELARLGLDGSETDASDHLPLVLDLEP